MNTNKKELHVFSGESDCGAVGKATCFVDVRTMTKIYTGDIVIVYKMTNTDVAVSFAVSFNSSLSTAVQYDGSIFIMGLKDAEFSDLSRENDWSDGLIVQRVKSYKDCIDGEKWADFSFTYRYV